MASHAPSLLILLSSEMWNAFLTHTESIGMLVFNKRGNKPNLAPGRQKL